MVINLKIILIDLLSSFDLAETWTFSIRKLAKVVMFDKNNQFVFTAVEIILPSFENHNNGKRFLIVSFIISLYKNYLFTKKSH